MRIMITGGGTGGHTSPALAVIEELRHRDPQLLLQWVGRAGGIEEQVAQRNNVPFRHLPVEGWSRKKSLRLIWTLAKLLYSVMRAWLYLRIFRPQVVFGVGGYVSLPVVWAAQWTGVPTVLHEQNKRLGLTNRLCARKCARLLLSYPETVGIDPANPNTLVTGNPVRAAFLEPPSREEARTALGLDPQTPTALIIGGSQGARTLNEAMAHVACAFQAGEAQFIWATGKAEALKYRTATQDAKATVQVHAFIEEIATACAAADVVVSRAGASSTAELAVLGKPSILVPYPHATDNHQEHNARAFEAAGAARVLLDSECSGETLALTLRELLSSPETLNAMGHAAKTLARTEAVDQIAETIIALVHGAPTMQNNQ